MRREDCRNPEGERGYCEYFCDSGYILQCLWFAEDPKSKDYYPWGKHLKRVKKCPLKGEEAEG